MVFRMLFFVCCRMSHDVGFWVSWEDCDGFPYAFLCVLQDVT